MKIFNSFKEEGLSLGPVAVAIGNFDGLHLGHKKIIEVLTEQARKLKLTSLVLTFSPHPEKILGQKPIKMIQTLNQRLQGLKEMGVESTLVVPFNDHFFRLRASQFIEDILIKKLQAKLVVVGQDFRFGYGRRGDPTDLATLGAKFGLKVEIVDPVIINGKVVSSSLIRQLLEKGQVDLAAVYLGRAYEIEGRVIKGDSRGKLLGLPTANIESNNEILPPGVFISQSQVEKEIFPSVTNIGQRPTFGSFTQIIESHLLDYQGNLYDRFIKTRLFKKIRDEKKFPDVESLRQQILKDIEHARLFWEKT
ncbi:MAG: bifunctional riboflavin kinase/FAD synthetase [Candidatus Aminicenantes bacterium]|nr:bifunctional riboflavin kinase/FAD synthetase [Candidatus Aminicenantes bacterium]